ncbi:MAG: hypothetical protein KA479_02735 [Saprospiraceae bacterium]|nr:hypothetical protein [Saprospiraceae bacterium]
MCGSTMTFAQSAGTIPLRNGGLEANWQVGFQMEAWGAWGTGATPDILPGQWSISKLPKEGKSYVGLIIREDGTKEGIVQKLDHQLEAGQCYYLSLALAHLPDYAGFKLPGSIRLKGRLGNNGKVFDLAMSPLITHEQWVYYTLEFTPSSTVDQVIIQASYAPGVTKPYRGNILIDHLSSFSRCLRASL